MWLDPIVSTAFGVSWMSEPEILAFPAIVNYSFVVNLLLASGHPWRASLWQRPPHRWSSGGSDQQIGWSDHPAVVVILFQLLVLLVILISILGLLPFQYTKHTLSSYIWCLPTLSGTCLYRVNFISVLCSLHSAHQKDWKKSLTIYELLVTRLIYSI